MAFAETEATGLVALIAILVLFALIIRNAVRSTKMSRDAASRRHALLDLEDRQRIAALRHKDFDTWFAADKARRARVGLPPLNKEIARQRRLDPTYQLDVPAPRRSELRRKRRELAEAVERGEQPVAEAPAE